MEEVVPSRGVPLVFSECSLCLKLSMLRHWVPQVQLSSWWRQKKSLGLKGEGRDSKVLGGDVCFQKTQSGVGRVAPSPPLELLTKVAVES
jgi:hypothetical protein